MIKEIKISQVLYDSLATKDSEAVYITDEGNLYKGNDKYVLVSDLNPYLKPDIENIVTVTKIKIGNFVLSDNNGILEALNLITSDVTELTIG